MKLSCHTLYFAAAGGGARARMFGLIIPRHEYYIAVRTMVERARGYWQARVDLDHATGGRLVGTLTSAAGVLSVDEVVALPPRAPGHGKLHVQEPTSGEARGALAEPAPVTTFANPPVGRYSHH